MWMRKVLLVVLLLALALSACGGDDDANQEPSATNVPKLRIALVMKTLTNPFFVEMERGARQAEADLGIELIVRTAAQETSIEQQIQIVDELIKQEVDAIVIAPGDSRELIPVLTDAQQAGIVVINIDNRLDPDVSATLGLEGVPFISVNNEQGAYLSAQYIAEGVTEPTEAIIIEGIRTAQNAQDRRAGAERAFTENDNITIVAQETANWKIDEGYSVAQQLFEAFPDVELVFAANDMMALGVVQYLQEQNRSDVKVAAYDALEEAKEAVAAGTLQVTIDQQAARQGYLGVEYAVRALAGEELPAETMVDVLVVDAATLAESQP